MVIDPDSRNERAIASYVKAGFTPYDTCLSENGTDILMELLPEHFDYATGLAQS